MNLKSDLDRQANNEKAKRLFKNMDVEIEIDRILESKNLRDEVEKLVRSNSEMQEQVERLIGNHDELNHDPYAPDEIKSCPKCQARKFLSPPQEDKP